MPNLWEAMMDVVITSGEMEYSEGIYDPSKEENDGQADFLQEDQ